MVREEGGHLNERERERFFSVTVNDNLSILSCSAVRERKQWHAAGESNQ